MRLPHIALLSLVAFAAPITAQTQLVRGDVDGIQHTAGQFVLKCSNIRLVSTTVNLQALHDLSRQNDIEFEMQVRDVSVGGQTILDVVSATQIPEQFDMGNLRFNRSETWEVFAAPNSPAFVSVNVTSETSYLPVGPLGTWILGLVPVAFQGTTNALGRFQFRYTMPTIPALVGVSISAQAVVVEGGVISITNPDCKEVRND